MILGCQRIISSHLIYIFINLVSLNYFYFILKELMFYLFGVAFCKHIHFEYIDKNNIWNKLLGG